MLRLPWQNLIRHSKRSLHKRIPLSAERGILSAISSAKWYFYQQYYISNSNNCEQMNGEKDEEKLEKQQKPQEKPLFLNEIVVLLVAE